jgi:hypothetical protein
MKKIINILAINFLLISSAFAETKEEKRAKYVLENTQNDYIQCYNFYKFGAEYIRNSNGDSDIIDGIEKSSDISLKLVYETGEIMGMTTEKMSSKVKTEMKNQLNQINNDFNKASLLLEKYGQLCKNLIEDKKQRISFWEKKAVKKFQ